MAPLTRMRSQFLNDDRELKPLTITGFSLIEVLVALGISSIVLLGAGSYFYYFSNQHNLFTQWSSVHQDSYISLDHLQNDLRNIVLINPAEDLSALNDNKYFGLASLSGREVPPDCLDNAAFNSLRTTILNRKRPPAKTLRLWDETISSGGAGPIHELRVSYDGTPNSLFRAGYAPQEIIIVDADRRFTRRYEVVSHTMELGTSIDPSDDINKAPRLFSFARVFVKRPKSAVGVSISKKPAVFVTSSEVFESSTAVYCTTRADKTVVRKTPTLVPNFNVFQVNNLDYSLKSFKFTFARTRTTQRVEDSSFLDSIFDPSQFRCTNLLKFQLEIEPSAARIAKMKFQNMSGSASTTIKRSRTLFLPNLNSVRQVSCQN